jgi:hypothetical protein
MIIEFIMTYVISVTCEIKVVIFRSADKTAHLDKSIIQNDGLRDASIGEHQA